MQTYHRTTHTHTHTHTHTYRLGRLAVMLEDNTNYHLTTHTRPEWPTDAVSIPTAADSWLPQTNTQVCAGCHPLSAWSGRTGGFKMSTPVATLVGSMVGLVGPVCMEYIEGSRPEWYISEACYIVEIYHSGPEPSIWRAVK